MLSGLAHPYSRHVLLLLLGSMMMITTGGVVENYYINSITGDDYSGNGTSITPWRSFSVLPTLRGGETIYLGGVFNQTIIFNLTGLCTPNSSSVNLTSYLPYGASWNVSCNGPPAITIYAEFCAFNLQNVQFACTTTTPPGTTQGDEGYGVVYNGGYSSYVEHVSFVGFPSGGLWLNNATDLTVRFCNFTANPQFGVFVESSLNTRIENSFFQGNNIGVSLKKSGGVVINSVSKENSVGYQFKAGCQLVTQCAVEIMNCISINNSQGYLFNYDAAIPPPTALLDGCNSINDQQSLFVTGTIMLQTSNFNILSPSCSTNNSYPDSSVISLLDPRSDLTLVNVQCNSSASTTTVVWNLLCSNHKCMHGCLATDLQSLYHQTGCGLLWNEDISGVCMGSCGYGTRSVGPNIFPISCSSTNTTFIPQSIGYCVVDNPIHFSFSLSIFSNTTDIPTDVWGRIDLQQFLSIANPDTNICENSQLSSGVFLNNSCNLYPNPAFFPPAGILFNQNNISYYFHGTIATPSLNDTTSHFVSVLWGGNTRYGVQFKLDGTVLQNEGPLDWKQNMSNPIRFPALLSPGPHIIEILAVDVDPSEPQIIFATLDFSPAPSPTTDSPTTPSPTTSPPSSPMSEPPPSPSPSPSPTLSLSPPPPPPLSPSPPTSSPTIFLLSVKLNQTIAGGDKDVGQGEVEVSFTLSDVYNISSSEVDRIITAIYFQYNLNQNTPPTAVQVEESGGNVKITITFTTEVGVKISSSPLITNLGGYTVTTISFRWPSVLSLFSSLSAGQLAGVIVVIALVFAFIIIIHIVVKDGRNILTFAGVLSTLFSFAMHTWFVAVLHRGAKIAHSNSNSNPQSNSNLIYDQLMIFFYLAIAALIAPILCNIIVFTLRSHTLLSDRDFQQWRKMHGVQYGIGLLLVCFAIPNFCALSSRAFRAIHLLDAPLSTSTRYAFSALGLWGSLADISRLVVQCVVVTHFQSATTSVLLPIIFGVISMLVAVLQKIYSLGWTRGSKNGVSLELK